MRSRSPNQSSVLAGRIDGLDDLVEVTLALADEMISLAGVSADPGARLADGSALGKWREMVTAQGGDPDALLPEASQRLAIRAERSGFITRLDALSVGIAAWRLGAGRSRKEDPVSATAGVLCVAKEGDAVEEGQPILELHVDDPERVRGAVEALDGAIDIGSEPPERKSLVLDVIRS